MTGQRKFCLVKNNNKFLDDSRVAQAVAQDDSRVPFHQFPSHHLIEGWNKQNDHHDDQRLS